MKELDHRNYSLVLVLVALVSVGVIWVSLPKHTGFKDVPEGTLTVAKKADLDEARYYPGEDKIAYLYRGEPTNNHSVQQWLEYECPKTAGMELGKHLMQELNLTKDTDIIHYSVSGKYDNRSYRINYHKPPSGEPSLQEVKEATPERMWAKIWFKNRVATCKIPLTVGEAPSTTNLTEE